MQEAGKGKLAVIFFIVFLLACFIFISWMHMAPIHKDGGDALIVLGYKCMNNEIHSILKDRLDAALDLYCLKSFQYIILSGGATGSETPEARLMEAYLLDKGVSKDRIILEEKATDTLENLYYSKQIIRKKGLEKCTVVSSSFHLHRVIRISRKIGFPIKAYCRRNCKGLLYQLPLTFNEIQIFIGTYNRLKDFAKEYE